MNKLTNLELKKISLKSYFFASGIITVSMIAFTYLLAITFQFSGDNDLELLNSYNNIVTITSLLNSFCFAVLSAVMYSKFIIKEYAGKNAILLFSYPINRTKVLYTKIRIVSVFIFITGAISSVLTFVLFFMTESFVPFISDTITIEVILQMIILSTSFAFIANGIGILSMQFGFWKKSEIATVVSSVIIISVVSQIFSATLDSFIFPPFFTVLFLMTSIFVIVNLSRKITYMEVC